MVYVIRHIKTGETAVLGINNRYTVGRSRLNNILLKDETCSHKHAEIRIKNGNAFILDVGSKRGTYVNRKKIVEETKLENGDVVRFGLNKCKYSFIDPKFQTVIDTSISGNEEITSREALKALNVTISETYNKECTHYTTEFISLDTLRKPGILDTLIDQKPLVKSKFWIEMINNIQEAAEIPNIYRYMPEIESTLKDKKVEIVIPSKKRDTLFKNKMCICYDQTLENNMRQLILKCGGNILQYTNQANFAITLVDEWEFDEVILIKQLPEEEPSLTETYFIDKLRQLDKTVHEMSNDDIYIAILNGSFDEETVEEAQDDIQVIAPVENGTPIVVEDNSGDEVETSNNSRMNKGSKSTLYRWVKPVKTPKTRQNQAECVGPEQKDDDDCFDISLDMNSDESSDEQEKISVKKKPNNKGNKLNKNYRDPVPTICSDDSEAEELPPKLTKILEGRNKKRNRHRQKEIIVEDKSSSDALNLELSKRLSSSTRYDDPASSAPPPPDEIKDLHQSDEKKSILTLSDDDNFQRKSKRNKRQIRGSSSRVNPKEFTKPTSSVSKIKCHEDKPSTSSHSRPEVEEKRFKVNPFAMVKNTKAITNKVTTLNLRRLRKRYEDVEFEPI